MLLCAICLGCETGQQVPNIFIPLHQSKHPTPYHSSLHMPKPLLRKTTHTPTLTCRGWREAHAWWRGHPWWWRHRHPRGGPAVLHLVLKLCQTQHLPTSPTLLLRRTPMPWHTRGALHRGASTRGRGRGCPMVGWWGSTLRGSPVWLCHTSCCCCLLELSKGKLAPNHPGVSGWGSRLLLRRWRGWLLPTRALLSWRRRVHGTPARHVKEAGA